MGRLRTEILKTAPELLHRTPTCAELASHFLDNYIVGDKYFNLDYPTHDLVCARCQIAPAKDVDKKLAIKKILFRLWDCIP